MEQLTPARSTRSPLSSCATSAGLEPVAVTPSLPNDIWAMIGRSVVSRATCTAALNSSRSEKVSRINRSAPASHNTPICSRKTSCAQRHIQLAVTLRHAFPQRPHRRRDPHSRPADLTRLARQLDAPKIQHPYLAGQARIIGQPQPVGAESVALDDLRAGPDIGQVDIPHPIRLRQVQLFQALLGRRRHARVAGCPWRRRPGSAHAPVARGMDVPCLVLHLIGRIDECAALLPAAFVEYTIPPPRPATARAAPRTTPGRILPALAVRPS